MFDSLRTINVSLSLVFTVVLFLVLMPDMVALGHDLVFDSPAFGNPEEVIEMPEEWVAQPIRKPSQSEDADVHMTLSYQLFSSFAPKIEQFAREHNFTVDIKESSCSTSTRLLAQKEVDIASFCCAPSRNDRLPGVQFHTLGISPVAILINKNNPIENLTLDDVMKVFRGEIVNWSKLGGHDLLIQPVARLHCKTRPGRWRPLNSSEELTPKILSVGAIIDNLEFIEQTHGSIGYESLSGMIATEQRANIKKLKIDGVDSTDLADLVKGKYPYYRSYSFSTWGGVIENPLAKRIVEFLKSEFESQSREYHFVSAEELRLNGWRFSDDELVGEPE